METTVNSISTFLVPSLLGLAFTLIALAQIFFSIILPILIGAVLSVILLILYKCKKKKISPWLNLRHCTMIFGAFAAVNVINYMLAFSWFFAYAVLFGPFIFFSVKLSKELCFCPKPNNRFFRRISKVILWILIWFMAFFPFSLFGIAGLLGIFQ